MYRLMLKCIFLISMCISFNIYFLVENGDQSYILKTVSLS
jgi:hypothetical protein